MIYYDVYFSGLSSVLTIYADSFRVSTDSYDDPTVEYVIFKVGSVIVAILELTDVDWILENGLTVYTQKHGLNVRN